MQVVIEMVIILFTLIVLIFDDIDASLCVCAYVCVCVHSLEIGRGIPGGDEAKRIRKLALHGNVSILSRYESWVDCDSRSYLSIGQLRTMRVRRRRRTGTREYRIETDRISTMIMGFLLKNSNDKLNNEVPEHNLEK